MPTPALPALQCSAVPENSSFSRALKPLLAGSLALLLVACGGGGGQLGTMDPDDLPKPPPPPESLYRVGTGAGAGFQEGLINASHPTLRAGDSALLRANIIDEKGNPVEAGRASPIFSSPCIATGLSTVSTPTEPTPGLFSVTYVNVNCAGTDTVTVRLPNNSRTASVTLNVHAMEALTVSHVSTSSTQLVLGGLGGLETSEVVFNLAGPQGTPIVGESVDFSVFSPTVAKATVVPGWESGFTDQDGNVRTIIRSGTSPGPVTVVAEHKATGIKGLSGDIIISTGIPAGNRFSISYGPMNPAEAYNTDGIEVGIHIIATDMFGNSPTDGTRVSFVSPEAGKVDDYCLLQDGQCNVTWISSRSTPHPADNRVEVLAYTDGAEGFTDMNGNSVYDAGDVLGVYDLPEPYADEDENGKFDPGEFFFDRNGNGVWDEGDKIWNGPCLEQVHPGATCPPQYARSATIFSSVTIVMSTNTPKILSLGPTGLTRFPNPGQFIYMQQGRTKVLEGLVIGDNYNNPLPIGTKVTFTIEGGGDVRIQGLNDFTIGNTTNAYSDVFGITLVAASVEIPLPIDLPESCTDDLPETTPNPGTEGCTQPSPELPDDVYLKLDVALPDGTKTTYSWPVNVQL